MAQTKATSSQQASHVIISPQGLTIEIRYADIFDVAAEAIVVPEGTRFGNLGFVAKHLIEISPKFKEERDKLIIQKQTSFEPWQVYTNKLGDRFKYVIHAIVTPCGQSEDKDDWKRQMLLLYKRIYQEADKKLSVLAVPLLASGKGNANIETAIEVAMSSAAQFEKTKQLSRIMFVCNDHDTVDQMANRCKIECKSRPQIGPPGSSSGQSLPKPSVGKENPKKTPEPHPHTAQPNPQTSTKYENEIPASVGLCTKRQLKNNPSTERSTPILIYATDKNKKPDLTVSASGVTNQHTKNTSIQEKGAESVRERVVECGSGNEPDSASADPPGSAVAETVNNHGTEGKAEQSRIQQCSGSVSQGGNKDAQNNLLVTEGSDKLLTKKTVQTNDETQDESMCSGNENQKPINKTSEFGGNNTDVNKSSDVKSSNGKDKLSIDKAEEHQDTESDGDGGGSGGVTETQGMKKTQNMNNTNETTSLHDMTKSASEGSDSTQNKFTEPDVEPNDDGEEYLSQGNQFSSGNKQNSKGKVMIPSLPDDIVKHNSAKADGTNFSQNKMSSLLKSDLTTSKKSMSCREDQAQRHEDGTNSQRHKDNFDESEGARCKDEKGRSGKCSDSFEEMNKTMVKSIGHCCPICLNEITDIKRLDKCGHEFCRDCIDDSFKHYKPVCPSCNMVYGVLTGNQPEGSMVVGFSSDPLSGYEESGNITITYNFPRGIQENMHPNPGQHYKGTTRRAYLPDCPEGRRVLKLLKVAFDRKLTFTIGRSTTTGQENVVTWNDIHHKTRMDGGPTRFGYPDPGYLDRVTDELASRGVSKENLSDGDKVT